jgi:hypothetical protein
VVGLKGLKLVEGVGKRCKNGAKKKVKKWGKSGKPAV